MAQCLFLQKQNQDCLFLQVCIHNQNQNPLRISLHLFSTLNFLFEPNKQAFYNVQSKRQKAQDVYQDQAL